MLILCVPFGLVCANPNQSITPSEGCQNEAVVYVCCIFAACLRNGIQYDTLGMNCISAVSGTKTWRTNIDRRMGESDGSNRKHTA